MEKNFGRKLSEQIKDNNKLDSDHFNKKIMQHIAKQNQYRKMKPTVFNEDSYDPTSEI